MASALDLTTLVKFRGGSGRTWTVGAEIGKGGTAAVFEVQDDRGASGAAKALRDAGLKSTSGYGTGFVVRSRTWATSTTRTSSA